MTTKSPAFRFYVKDWLADPAVMVMTLEQQGAYLRLLCCCWTDGGIPDDVKVIAGLLGVGTRKAGSLWGVLKSRFTVRVATDACSGTSKLLSQPRLEEERTRQRNWSETRAEAGRKGAESRWGSKDKRGRGKTKPKDKPPDGNGKATDLPMAKHDSAFASAFATAVVPPKPPKGGSGQAPPDSSGPGPEPDPDDQSILDDDVRTACFQILGAANVTIDFLKHGILVREFIDAGGGPAELRKLAALAQKGKKPTGLLLSWLDKPYGGWKAVLDEQAEKQKRKRKKPGGGS